MSVFWFCGLTFAAAASQDPQDQPRPAHVLPVIKAMALTVKVRLRKPTVVATQLETVH